MIVLFDNRRMAAITGLQEAQYGAGFATDDEVAVDYAALASAVSGVRGIAAGDDAETLSAALKDAAAHPGLSLVHVPVHWGTEDIAGLGAFGDWNVGNWCDRVQRTKHEIGL